jgi:hypothetical protein
MTNTITVSGTECKVAHEFSDSRVIINYDGLFVLADKGTSGWELSGTPANHDEMTVLKDLTASMNDVYTLNVVKQ